MNDIKSEMRDEVGRRMGELISRGAKKMFSNSNDDLTSADDAPTWEEMAQSLEDIRRNQTQKARALCRVMDLPAGKQAMYVVDSPDPDKQPLVCRTSVEMVNTLGGMIERLGDPSGITVYGVDMEEVDTCTDPAILKERNRES